ncbi:hypothetical protein ERO13_A09G177850v2 [Gossypium hirsutum]|uniref:Protein PLANT CADMIUM RESISTANCE 6 n=1 Tax=Gossypium hirsutum TaxID=3635 RepID=A0A1U8LV21_GOSHI|nr:protein PLANT CADMIUM RESISTANCE 6-like [Gossypium hirsutum]KAG4184539.1 hypothetical protein ERO13_A09G177850v2 [Gossypium hirsutum]
MAQIEMDTHNLEFHGAEAEYVPNRVQASHPYGLPTPSAPPTIEAAWLPTPQAPHSNEPNAIYHHHQQGAIYEQPPPPAPSYPQDIGQRPFASTYASHSQPFQQAAYQVPPGYVVMAPYVHSTYQQHVEGWKTGLFDCMDDPVNALITVCFPCVTFGQVAEIVDEGRTSCASNGLLYGVIALLIGIPCILSCGYRTKLRNKFQLSESPAPDWVVHCFCDCCALCQEYRELHQRGWDPSTGWHGNLARRQNMHQQQQYVMMAPINQTMMG